VAVEGAEAPPIRSGATHEEARAHEGQVDYRNAKRVPEWPTDSHVDEGPEGDQRRRSKILGNALRAPRLPHLGRGKAS
jgi:hypothetical protein